MRTFKFRDRILPKKYLWYFKRQFFKEAVGLLVALSDVTT
jgi:hypothetical protein